MVHGQTRPLFVSEDENWFVTYRQYCGEGTTHGQLGGASSEDGEEWYHYWNINSNGNPPWGGGGVCDDGTCAQARYPSALGSWDYPIAIWTEYTGDNSSGSLYGGRPYSTFDEFEWDGGSFTYPMDLIPDFIPVSGIIDDVALIAWIYKSVQEDIEKFLDWESNNKE